VRGPPPGRSSGQRTLFVWSRHVQHWTIGRKLREARLEAGPWAAVSLKPGNAGAFSFCRRKEGAGKASKSVTAAGFRVVNFRLNHAARGQVERTVDCALLVLGEQLQKAAKPEFTPAGTRNPGNLSWRDHGGLWDLRCGMNQGRERRMDWRPSFPPGPGRGEIGPVFTAGRFSLRWWCCPRCYVEVSGWGMESCGLKQPLVS